MLPLCSNSYSSCSCFYWVAATRAAVGFAQWCLGAVQAARPTRYIRHEN